MEIPVGFFEKLKILHNITPNQTFTPPPRKNRLETKYILFKDLD